MLEQEMQKEFGWTVEVCRELIPDESIEIRLEGQPLMGGNGSLYRCFLTVSKNDNCLRFLLWQHDFRGTIKENKKSQLINSFKDITKTLNWLDNEGIELKPKEIVKNKGGRPKGSKGKLKKMKKDAKKT